MAWHQEKDDIVFDGWEQGMADSPFEGHTLVRLVNVVDSPKEAFVGFDLLNQYTQPVTCAGSTSQSTDLFTYTRATDPIGGAKNIIMTGTPIVFSTIFPSSGGASLFGNRIYYAVFNSATATTGTFKIATTLANALAGTTLDLDSSTSGNNVTPVGPAFSGFSGTTGQITPYPTTYTDTTGAAFQYMGDSTGSENGSTWKGTGNLWYYVNVSSSRTGWSIAHPGTALEVVSVDPATEQITMPAGTTFATGTALVLNVNGLGTMPTGLTAGTTYYAINVSATDFKLATTLANALANTPINITGAGSGTINVMFAEGVYGVAANWGYVFVFRNYQVDVMKISDYTWTIGWKTNLTAALSHRAIPAQDDAIYFCNGNKVGSILQNAGQTFSPSSTTTYTYNTSALALPATESAISLVELGVNLLIGGVFAKIYPWDRLSTGTLYPLLCPEQNIAEMVTVNTTTYIFAGYRGRIYQTNGNSVDFYKKLPDYTAGIISPQFYWKCSGNNRNELLFSVEVFDNSSTIVNAQQSSAGLWAINLRSKALRYYEVFSIGLSSSFTNTFAPFVMSFGGLTETGGESFLTGWTSLLSSTRYSGFDGFVAQNPTTNGGTPDGAYLVGGAQLLTDLIRVGTNYTKKTFSQVEWTTSMPLANGEKVQIEARNSIQGTFVTVGSTTAAAGSADLSATYNANFQKYIWLQLRITLYSNAFSTDPDSPSYVRLRDVRVR